MSYHGCSGNKGSTLSHIAKRFNASTKGDLCGFDTKRIEPACFYGCKSWHLADLLSTVHFLRRFVSVQNTQFRWLSGRYRTFWVKKTETKYEKKKNVFLNVQPEYKESWIYALLHLKKHLSLKHPATAYHATPCYVIGSKSFRPDIQNRAKWKML